MSTRFVAIVYKFIIVTYCILEICHDVRTVKNGRVTYSGHLIGDTANYHCNSGYSHHGPNVRYCLASGRWTGRSTRCESEWMLIMQM